MIQSMTAFARSERRGSFGNLVCEIRSINHRFLEISLHLPEILRVYEMPLRDLIRKNLKRGKVECAIRYQPNLDSASFTINVSLAQELVAASKQIAAFVKDTSPIFPTDILRFPGVLETKETDIAELENEILSLNEIALKELVSARSREGKELKQLFLQRLASMQEQLVKVRERLPNVLKDQEERLIKRFNDAKIDLDPNRLEQEMVLFAQRIDISEEIDRTETHITEVRRVLNEDGSIGRRLDFLMQELNREANTFGSKSVDPMITHAAVEMKVLIEQVREQVQNIE